MSSRVSSIGQALVTLVAVAAIGVALFWATQASGPVAEVAERAVATPEAAPAADQPVAETTTDPEAAATATTAPPTATAVPSPTPTPVAVAFTDLVGRPDLEGALASPLPGCTLHGIDSPAGTGGTLGIGCIEEWSSVDVTAVGPGRIVHIGTADPVDVAIGAPTGGAGVWSWTAQSELGPHVVVDHGPFAGSRNVQTVYAGLTEIAPDLTVGSAVELETPLGTIAGPHAQLGFSLWDANVRHDGAVAVLDGPDLDTQRAAAAALGPLLASPTDPLCPLSLGGGQLPGAARPYRNGIHQGIDFGCGTSDRFGHAIADGRVVFVVNDYGDPTVADREALLRNAGIAGFTPHWTLVMLYGNVVVIDHGTIDGAGRVYSIAAHLEAVDPAITLGALVTRDQVIGELGNRGTNASSQGIRGAADPSLHLHWELFIDNWYLGSGQSPAAVSELIATALCDAAATPGCPA